MIGNNKDNHVDDHVDVSISEYTDLNSLSSFFLLAGAGSGKTRSLVKALDNIESKSGEYLRNTNKKVAVITYTNAASDEIKKRVNYNSNFHISTIHSFAWTLISSYTQDIKMWLVDTLELKISDLEGKKQTESRVQEISKLKKRLEDVNMATKFIYSPDSNNYEWNAINHSEVLNICAFFLENKKVFSMVTISKYPIIFVDECQDTSKKLANAFIYLSNLHKGEVSIGFFGDTMQRIYLDGIYKLNEIIPPEWEEPKKKVNHRSAKRIVELSNSIRGDIDFHQQSRSDSDEGVVRLFVVNNSLDKDFIEEQVCINMQSITNDSEWGRERTKKLILEHMMAASRLGFSSFFEPLRKVSSLSMSLLDGTFSEAKILGIIVSELLQASIIEDDFRVMSILKKHSPKMSRKYFESKSGDESNILSEIKKSTEILFDYFDENKDPRCIDILRIIYEEDLFPLPQRVSEYCFERQEGESDSTNRFREAFSVKYSEFMEYFKYVNGESEYDTQQGVKGLEFENVMVIMSDEESNGFLFSYDKLFGVKELSSTDIININNGEDNSKDRVNRLFYVACTRAEKSLALIAYTSDVEVAADTMLRNEWFLEDEVIKVNTEKDLSL